MNLAQTSDDMLGLTTEAHLFVALVTVAALAFVLRLLRRGQIESRYALLWVGTIVPLGLLAAFPGLLTRVSDAAGVFYPPALFLLLAVAFLFVVVVQFSHELSRLNERTRTLAEEVALLRAEREGQA